MTSGLPAANIVRLPPHPTKVVKTKYEFLSSEFPAHELHKYICYLCADKIVSTAIRHG